LIDSDGNGIFLKGPSKYHITDFLLEELQVCFLWKYPYAAKRILNGKKGVLAKHRPSFFIIQPLIDNNEKRS